MNTYMIKTDLPFPNRNIFLIYETQMKERVHITKIATVKPIVKDNIQRSYWKANNMISRASKYGDHYIRIMETTTSRGERPDKCVGKNPLDQIRKYIIENEFVEESQYLKAIRNDIQMKNVLADAIGNMNYKKIILTTFEYNYAMQIPLTYKQRIMAVDEEGQEEVTELFKELFRNQGITKEKLFLMFKTMFGENGKVNTIGMFGPASTGKTCIMRLFQSIYERSEIGKITPQGIKSQFWLADLDKKRIFLGDEIYAIEENIDTMKLLMEGNDNLCTEVKYGGKVYIEPMPVIIAGNDPVYSRVNGCVSPLQHRMIEISMKDKKADPRLHAPLDDLRIVLKNLYNWTITK